MPPSTPLPDPRKTAPIIWAALLFGQLAFLVVAWFARPSIGPGGQELTRVLLPVLAVFASVFVLLSRILPPRLPRHPSATLDQHALSRNIVASALCEGTGLFAIVVFMVTGSPVALALLLLPLGGLVACYPSDARWEALGGSPRDETGRGLPE